MARGVRVLKGKTIVQLSALELFLNEFHPAMMISALVDLVELAATHPSFGQDGHSGQDEHDWADLATTLLESFFGDVADRPGAARVVLDLERGTIALLHKRLPTRRRQPSIRRATKPVPLILSTRPHAPN